MPEEPVVVTPPSAIYRTIRAATALAKDEAGVDTKHIPKRPRWWKGRKRPTVLVGLTEQLYHTITQIAAQENTSLAGTARTLMALGASRYDHIISERIIALTKMAIEEIDERPTPQRARREREWAEHKERHDIGQTDE
jgi:hypothetical protein